jgi:hypothetical protein
MLLFGGPNLERSLDTRPLNYERLLLPVSNQRYLFVFENDDKFALIFSRI